MGNKPQSIYRSESKRRRIIRGLLLVAGTISLALGAIGVVMPLLPTTPFLLLSAACYLRSSERMHKWLLSNRWFGKYIKDYKEGRGIPKKTKILAMIVLWASILFSAFFFLNEVLVAQVALLIIALGVSVHVVRLPTLKT